MKGTTMNTERAAPLWAVLGAPLVGVPLMVLLLALSAPAQPAPEAEVDTEQVEIQAVDEVLGSSLESRLDCDTQPIRIG